MRVFRGIDEPWIGFFSSPSAPRTNWHERRRPKGGVVGYPAAALLTSGRGSSWANLGGSPSAARMSMEKNWLSECSANSLIFRLASYRPAMDARQRVDPSGNLSKMSYSCRIDCTSLEGFDLRSSCNVHDIPEALRAQDLRLPAKGTDWNRLIPVEIKFSTGVPSRQNKKRKAPRIYWDVFADISCRRF